MKRLIAIFVLSLIIIPIAHAQEIVSTENCFTNYHATAWEVEKESKPLLIYIGDDYFGFIKQGGGTYKHYDKSGNLVWSSESLDYEPRYVNLNRSGDKIQIYHNVKETNGYWYVYLDFFDVNDGHFLKLTGPRGNFLLQTSPSGKYYYNVNSELQSLPLGVYDENGTIVYDSHGGASNAKALDDSLIIYLDKGTIKIIDVFKNEIIKQRPVSEVNNNKINRYFINCSRDGQKFVIWNKWNGFKNDYGHYDIIILDKNINVLGYIPVEGNIHGVSFSNDSDALCCYTSLQMFQDYSLMIIDLNGEIISKQNIISPQYEKLSGNIRGMSFCNEFIAVRLSLYDKRNKQRYWSSVIAQVDIDSKSIVSHSIIHASIYFINNSSDEFIEETENSVKIWTKEEGNNE